MGIKRELQAHPYKMLVANVLLQAATDMVCAEYSDDVAVFLDTEWGELSLDCFDLTKASFIERVLSGER